MAGNVRLTRQDEYQSCMQQMSVMKDAFVAPAKSPAASAVCGTGASGLPTQGLPDVLASSQWMHQFGRRWAAEIGFSASVP